MTLYFSPFQSFTFRTRKDRCIAPFHAATRWNPVISVRPSRHVPHEQQFFIPDDKRCASDSMFHLPWLTLARGSDCAR